MKIVAIDTETHLIKPGMLFPKLVCLSWNTESDFGLALAKDARKLLDRWIEEGYSFVGHNISYDFGVLVAEFPDLLVPVFHLYIERRVYDTRNRAKLLDIALGHFDRVSKSGKHPYGLAALALREGLGVIEKEDTWRLHFAALENVPVENWPSEAYNYAVNDAVTALQVFFIQREKARAEGSTNGYVVDESNQNFADWCLHLMAGWGPRTNFRKVHEFEATLVSRIDEVQQKLLTCGLVRLEKATRSKPAKYVVNQAIVQGRVAKCLGRNTPRTAKGAVAIGEDVLLSTGDPDLLLLASIASAKKLLSTYIPALKRGTTAPLTSRPNVLVDTGRTSWGDPNLQNPPREGIVRECFEARPGMVYISADFDAAELRAHAQNCLELFGFSVLADVFRQGKDPHIMTAASIAGMTYEELERLYNAGDKKAEEARQQAKAANFGFPGGMGPDRFLSTYRHVAPSGLSARDLQQWSMSLKNAWLDTFPENRKYLYYISNVVEPEGRQVHPWSGRVRGGITYTSGANGFFQGRVADGAKLALTRLAYACYCDTKSILFGARPILFLHDEIILECPEYDADGCAREMANIMVSAMAEVIPDIPITAKPVAMRRWYKGAKPVFVEGLLVPGKPKKSADGKKTTWVYDELEDTQDPGSDTYSVPNVMMQGLGASQINATQPTFANN